jgi:hypothetical protein
MAELDTCEVLVLLSGGIDSSACPQFYCEIGRAPAALFVDYGAGVGTRDARNLAASPGNLAHGGGAIRRGVILKDALRDQIEREQEP